MTRRELLTTASTFIAAGMIPRTFSADTSDLDFASALDVACQDQGEASFFYRTDASHARLTRNVYLGLSNR
jgi:hypothetical protein